MLKKLSMQEYQRNSAVSRSFLVDMLKSPAHAKWNSENKEAPTLAMLIGSATHTMLLEPELFDGEYLVADIDRRTTVGKELDAKAKLDNLTVLKTEQKQIIDDMIASIKANKSATKMLKNGQAEMSIFWQDKETGINCKARMDYVRSEGIIIDLKTCLDASPAAFEKTILANNYHVQAAMYLDGLFEVGHTSVAFCFIAVEKEAPYGVGVYTITDDYIEIGRKIYKAGLVKLKECLDLDFWPMYPDEIIELAPPAWLKIKE